MKKIALILCGSGFKDGSEIRESVAAIWSLSQMGIVPNCFALDTPQHHVMNCLTGEESAGESRNQLIESARIARGKVQALSTLRPEEFDGLMIPGGYGVAKNLCTFAFKGSQGTVNSEIEKIVKKFYALKKPIGAICIAPALVGLVLKGQNIELTLGPSGEASQEIEKLGHKHIIKSAKEWHVDRAHKILSTPAYMIDDSPLADIFEGIAGMTKELVKMC